MNQKEEAEYRRAVSKYSASYMSNSKWLKCFRAVIASGVVIEQARWKFIDTEHFVEVSFPEERDLESTRFADGKFQPFEYCWLEYVFIPHVFRPKVKVGYVVEQDTTALVAALNFAGQFALEVSSEGVKIWGYRP